MVPGPVGEAPLVAAVLVVEVLRQLLDHLELPGLVLVVAVTNSRLDDIFVHRARRREAEVALGFQDSCCKGAQNRRSPIWYFFSRRCGTVDILKARRDRGTFDAGALRIG